MIYDLLVSRSVLSTVLLFMQDKKQYAEPKVITYSEDEMIEPP